MLINIFSRLGITGLYCRTKSNMFFGALFWFLRAKPLSFGFISARTLFTSLSGQPRSRRRDVKTVALKIKLFLTPGAWQEMKCAYGRSL